MDCTVIVPCYNIEKYVVRLIDSLKRQKLGHYEVEYIFVMNNCTDHTEDVIKANFSEAKIMHCKDQGCGCARNTALEVAQGKYIWFVDGDDWLLSDNAIRSAIASIEHKRTPLLRLAFRGNRVNAYHYSMVWQYIFSKELIGDLRFRHQMPSEDLVFMLKIFHKMGIKPEDYKNLPMIATPLYYYNYMREGSTMYNFYKGRLPVCGLSK